MRVPARILAYVFTLSQVIAAPICHYTFVTTDVNGDAKVRLTLTGDPRDFVRAVSLP